MTDNELIKALECCLSSNDLTACWKCPAVKLNICCDGTSKISNGIAKAVIDLINRYNAKIERLESNLKFVRGTVERLRKYDEERDIRLHARLTKTAKVETIKDVLLTLEAEALSSDKYIEEYDDSTEQKAYNQALWKAYNLVKEMVGDE